MLATDGQDCFAFFIYNDSNSVINLTTQTRVVGFAAGDGDDENRTAIVLNQKSSNGILAGINIFRIDGIHYLLLCTILGLRLLGIILYKERVKDRNN